MSYDLTGRADGYLCGFSAGKFNQSVYGGGASAAIPIANTADFTIEAWLLATNSSGFQVAFGKDDQFFMGIRGDGNYSVQYNAASGGTAVGSFPVPTDGLFHHISFNHDHVAGTTFYVDGVLVGSNPAPLKLDVNPNYPFYALNIRNQSSQYWGGSLEDLVIWNSVKRTANFSVPTIATPNSATGMLALYHFDGDLVDSAYLAGNKVNLTGPTTGLNNTASSDFSVAANGAIASNVVVTPSDAGDGGTFSPSTITLTSAVLSGTFQYTPSKNGAKTISITNSGGLQNSPALTYTVSTAATSLSITGPSSSRSPSESSPFTVTPNGAIVGTVVVTPSDGSGGIFTPNTLTLNSATSTGSFTYVAATAGNKSISITNDGGLTNPAALSVVANPAKVAVPTASTAGNRVVTVGVGKNYNTSADFATYLATQNLVVNQEMLIAEFYDNTSWANLIIGPVDSSDNFYCILRPVPGYDEASLNPTGPFTFGVDGLSTELFQTKIQRGVSVQNWRINCPPGVGYDTSCGFQNGSGRPYELIRNRIQSNATQQYLFYFGTDYSSGKILDNLFIFNGSSTIFGLYGDVNISRNTFVWSTLATGSLFTKNATASGSYVRDNAFINASAIPAVIPADIATHCSNNYTDQPLSSPINGFISNTSSPFLVSTTNYLPATGSPLLGNASPSSISVNDNRIKNRGLTPDVGAAQLVPAVPLPTGTVTSQPSPDGQTVIINFSTTGSPTSAIAILYPSSNNPAGAISSTGVVVLGTNTGTATWTGVSTGNYSPDVKISNSGGAGDVLGEASVTIMGISGNPVAAPAALGPATAISVIGPSNGAANALSADFTVSLNGNISSNVTITMTSSVAGDTFSPTTIVLTPSFPSDTFNITASSTGARTITITNSGTLSNQAPLTYTTAAVSAVTSVTISPTNSTGDQQFISVVNGTGSPSQAVTWTCTQGVISNTGNFAAPAKTSVIQNVTVKVKSVQDITKFAIASVTVPAADVITRKISFTVTDVNGNPLVNLTGLKAAVFAETAPDIYNAPIYKKSGVSTNALGLMEFIFPCNLVVGTIVGLDISNTNGTTSQAPSAIGFTGPVVLV